ncbi:DUF6376 family protein [Paenibacillus urinalis]|uniref:DUF6376 family protein n=1 Tax=Paenibacillus urinalis TaxID=521520 RepID=A0ABY7XHT5_9BACL|nr:MULTISPECIES: DUF6376 family protein [Paenibacillus]WDH96080.1 DUF6376 family protein [Paenibacillus urinalis]WDI04301.1 DUF6376 family protein [Paenibacillus urinalis]
MRRQRKRKQQAVMMATMLASAVMLSACSAVESVNQSLNYVNEATEYINQVSTAGSELQNLAQEAVNNPDAAAQFQEQLEQIRTEASEFAQLTPPAIGESIHARLVEYNEQLTGMVDQFSQRIQEQGFTLENWEQTGIPDLITNINNLSQQLNELGG